MHDTRHTGQADVRVHDALADVLHRFWTRRDDLGHDVAAAFVAVITPAGFDAVGWWRRWCDAQDARDVVADGRRTDQYADPGPAERTRRAVAEENAATAAADVFGELLAHVTCQDLGARVALWAPIDPQPIGGTA